MQVVEAHNLKGADSSLLGRSRSDPYCVIQGRFSQIECEVSNMFTSCSRCYLQNKQQTFSMHLLSWQIRDA